MFDKFYVFITVQIYAFYLYKQMNSIKITQKILKTSLDWLKGDAVSGAYAVQNRSIIGSGADVKPADGEIYPGANYLVVMCHLA